MEISQSIGILLNDIREAIIQDQKDKGIRSSGKSAESLTISVYGNTGTLSGAKYFVQQTLGRKPGKFPPIDDILDWIRAKRISPRDPKTTERQLAFLFARKIARSGTDIFQGKRPGLDMDEIIAKLVKEWMAQFGKDFQADVTKTITKSVTAI